MTMQDLAWIAAPLDIRPIENSTRALKFPMASEPLVGALLRVLAAAKPGGRFLELGTGTGMATAWLLDGMNATSTLTSVDVDPDVQQIARNVLGDDRRLTLELVDGLEFLARQQAEGFDLVFADAMAGKYDGLDAALRVVKPGGFYVIDDMLPQPSWPDGHAAKIPLLMNALASHPDFDIVPLIWATGLVIAVRRSTSRAVAR